MAQINEEFIIHIEPQCKGTRHDWINVDLSICLCIKDFINPSNLSGLTLSEALTSPRALSAHSSWKCLNSEVVCLPWVMIWAQRELGVVLFAFSSKGKWTAGLLIKRAEPGVQTKRVVFKKKKKEKKERVGKVQAVQMKPEVWIHAALKQRHKSI